MDENQFFFQARILDTNDPLMLGRVRAIKLIENEKDALKGVTDPPWNPEKDPWTKRDPLIFAPLLPYYLYSVPKVNELVIICYMNKDFKYQNQYYIQSPFTSPTTIYKEFFIGPPVFGGTAMQFQIPIPLKNKDGSYTNEGKHQGVFPEPGDNSLMGRNSADIIVKDNDVLIRAGKIKGEKLQPNVLPIGNPNRGFFQLSRFQSIPTRQPPQRVTQLNEVIVNVKYLIEWTIVNPENGYDKFSGFVFLYQLKPDPTVNSANLTESSLVDEKLKVLTAQEEFKMLSSVEVIKFINDFIKACNSSTKTFSGTKLFSSNNAAEKFPIFYRPSNLMYSKINLTTSIGTNTSPDVKQNLEKIYRGIKLQEAQVGGFGLIYAKDKVGKPKVPKRVIIQNLKYSTIPQTIGAIGADTIYLLAHNEKKPSKNKINYDGTLYGISPEKFADIKESTSSSVRGEELLQFLDLIVRFLTTHTHAIPGDPPVPVSFSGVKTEQISEAWGSRNNFLNKNIRIN